MLAEFEEKPYEQHLTSELIHGRRLFFPPGQVLENIVGFDVAIRTSDRRFWRLFPHMRSWWHSMLFLPPPGTRLDNQWWSQLEDEVQHFPRYKFNCFIQAKRPERMVRSDAAEYSTWNSRYFRYDAFLSQQQALEVLARNVSAKAIVVYASPSFHTYHELWVAISASQLVAESNFCEVAQMSGHSRYSYVDSGNAGFAHSDGTPIESTPFSEALDALEAEEPQQSNLEFIQLTSAAVDTAAEELGPLSEAYRAMVDKLFQDTDVPLAKHLARIYAFQYVCNVRLLLGYEG